MGIFVVAVVVILFLENAPIRLIFSNYIDRTELGKSKITLLYISRLYQMNPKTILNSAILFIGLSLAAYSQLNKGNQQSPWEWRKAQK